MKVGLPALFAAACVIACDGSHAPTAPGARGNTSNVISDGAHGGANKDFFFLPPLLPSPTSDPNFDAGKFNSGLRPSLQVQICELGADHLNAQGRPTDATSCAAGSPIASFAPGSVQLVAHPRSEIGWWTLFNLPADGFYYVLWDTHATNRLDASKYYRVKVSIAGVPDLLGYADVDPIQNLTQWKNALTGEVIQMVNGTILPIPFRVENGGGSVLCGTSSVCNSVTISNNDPSGVQVVNVEGGAGSIAGASFPNGWLPASGPQSVVVTISQVDLGSTNVVTGAESKPCHAGLPLLQFPGCFNFATIPALQPIAGTTDEFAKSVTVAVCYALSGSGDPREKFAEMYSSGPNEPAHALVDASDVGLLSSAARNCSTSAEVIGLNGGNALTRLASAAWRNTTSALGHLFGVKTAYAVDLGLGGLTKSFSNVGPVLPATMQPATFSDVTLDRGQQSTVASVKITGNHSHSGAGIFSGVNGVPVNFTVAGANGVLSSVTGQTSSGSISVNTATDGSVDGIASVTWTLPNTPGTYTMTATAPTSDAPITFTATVPPLYDPWTGTASIASAGPVAFGGGAFCNYTVELDNIQGSLDLDNTGGGSSVVTATQNEVAAAGCPFPPSPQHLDMYASTSVARTGNNVVATFMPVGNPISASLTFVGVMSADAQTVSGTFTWHRIDQQAPLDWTVVVDGTLTRTVPDGGLTPALVFSGSEFYQANGFNWVRYRLGVTNFAVYPAEMFAPRPDLPPCGLNTSASRTWVDIYDASNDTRIYGFCGLKSPTDLNLLWFATAVGTSPPSQVYIKLTDRATGAVYKSNNVSPVSPP